MARGTVAVNLPGGGNRKKVTSMRTNVFYQMISAFPPPVPDGGGNSFVSPDKKNPESAPIPAAGVAPPCVEPFLSFLIGFLSPRVSRAEG
jgi:hypothetical protein